MSQQTTGTIKELYQEKTYGNKGFKKREFVISTEDKYPQDVIFETHSDMCAKLDQFRIGERVTVEYNLRGREYQGKYYNNLQAWKVSHSNQTEVTDQLPDRNQETADLPF
tara:strand:+ start:58 stop:387 length:330 start_codon:yes stop_codon:yes gene_type:complete